MTSPFTCITCQVAFRDLEVQRQHYKSDWHRYNLKRKVAELPPVKADEFQRRVLAQCRKDDQMRQEKALNCRICKKSFSCKNQYTNHLISKKHKDNCVKSEVGVKEEGVVEESNEIAPDTGSSRINDKNDNKNEGMEIDSDVESVDSDEWIEDTENPVKSNNCLFCNHHSRSFVRNLKHMSVAHSFFIPDTEYCINIKGLLVYLGEKVFAGYMCLWCNDSGKAFQSADAARAHMIDKGHCKVRHEGEALAEYVEFYDYSSSYPDAEHEDPDAEVQIPELDDSDYQLVLPSGSMIGHRSLMRYYKQNLNPNRAMAVSKKNKLDKVLSQYRALGWKDTQKEAVVKKIRDIKYMQKIHAKYSTQLQFKANKLQKHFRPQVNF
ncbi:zinc finger protein 622 [Orussus abietinus]|uniref:zinc finger protein 622 n=1 Tax=Orussus abietinus TaxID=222816 RepID=UPI000626E05F|nr:zinc finger protein 622 [Orussus abietinus]XP_023289823.1 zinc finger protein 622 [Orussus abietinus]